MILQALYEYYERKAADPDSTIAPIGFEWKELPFLIIIDREGHAIRLEDNRKPVGKKRIGRRHLLPQSIGRSGKNAWQTSFLLWDHWGYVLGHPKSDSDKDRATAEKQLETFTNRLMALPDSVKQTPDVAAVLRFYEQKEYYRVFDFENWPDCAEISGCNLSFQLQGETELVASCREVKEYQGSQALLADDTEQYEALCLISGKRDVVQRLHAATPIPGGQSTGKLVGFQKDSGFDSYGKEQGANAPVGKYAHTAYTTALNTLTKSDTNKMALGDMTIVFWAQKPCMLEQAMPSFFVSPPKDKPDKGVKAVKQLYESLESGKLDTEENTNRFYVLGLAPNAARIAVRYWLTGTVAEFSTHLKAHFDDLEIVRSDMDAEYFSLHRLLAHTALEFKISNVPPNLAGEVARSVLEGRPYPQTLLHACVRRIRAEQHVSRIRAAMLKACINRYNRFHNKTHEEVITVGLDKSNMNPAYRLGRLFALLERIQIESAKPVTLNSTIRERYYGAASSTPITVFPKLLKLKNHHIAKLPSGIQRMYEAMIGGIIEGLDAEKLPKQLPLDQQALFAIGYYHQARYRRRFMITPQVLELLRGNGIPNDVVKKLEGLLESEIQGVNKFMVEVEAFISKKDAKEYKDVLVKYADRERETGVADEEDL